MRSHHFSNAFIRGLSLQKCDSCYVRSNGTVFILYFFNFSLIFRIYDNFFTDFGAFFCTFVDVFTFFLYIILTKLNI